MEVEQLERDKHEQNEALIGRGSGSNGHMRHYRNGRSFVAEEARRPFHRLLHCLPSLLCLPSKWTPDFRCNEWRQRHTTSVSPGATYSPL